MVWKLRALASAIVCIISLAAGLWSGQAQESVSFKGQTIDMLLGWAVGGGVDATGRALSPLLIKYLPGQPNIIVRYMPGANGVIAFNCLAQQTKPDGLTFTIGTAEQVDPFNFRKPGSYYDPRKFEYFGGIHRGGNALVINREAEKRLYDKNAAPVIMGSVGSRPRAGNQVTLWGIKYLGWNARWVTGYAGTNDVILALHRGEVDMTATANLYEVKGLLDSGKFRIINQSGSIENGRSVGRADFGDVPLVTDMLAGKITDPLGQKAFKYWFDVTALDKILAVVPGTPPPGRRC